jgi:hypothetical protein
LFYTFLKKLDLVFASSSFGIQQAAFILICFQFLYEQCITVGPTFFVVFYTIYINFGVCRSEIWMKVPLYKDMKCQMFLQLKPLFVNIYKGKRRRSSTELNQSGDRARKDKLMTHSNSTPLSYAQL